jgi:hypothetical protein
MADPYALDFTGVKLGQTYPGPSLLGGANQLTMPFGPTSSQQALVNDLKTYGPMISIAGAVGQIFGAYYAAKSQQYQLDSQAMSLQFQKDIAGINARQAEVTAQGILRAGEQQAGALTMKYGKAKGAQRAAMAANGGVMNEGSNAEIEATNELMKEIDVYTINANTVRSAENARTQSQNYKTQAAMFGISANNMAASSASISPLAAAGTSLLTSATSYASTLYRDKMMDRLLARAT